MAVASGPLKHQRMQGTPPEGGVEPPPPDDPPQIGVFQLNSRLIEGAQLDFQVRRLGGLRSQAMSFNYAFTSEAGTADFSGATSGTQTIGADVDTMAISAQSVQRAGVQNDREITCSISNAMDGTINPIYASSTMTLEDFIPPVAGAEPKYQPSVAVNKWHCVGFTPPASEGTAKAVYPAGRTGFAQAVTATNWVAGDVIVLADGDYTGNDLVIARNGTLNDPNDGSKHLMIRSRNHGRAVIKFQLQVTGAYVWITGLSLPFSYSYAPPAGDGWRRPFTSIIYTNRGLWITNCICTSRAFASIDGSNAAATVDNLKFCYNTMDLDVKADDRGTSVVCFYNWPEGRNAPDNSDIAYNICRQMTKPQDVVESDDPELKFDSDDQSRSFVNFQPSKPNAGVESNQTFKFHHNHIRGYFRIMMYSKRNFYIGYSYFEPEAIQTNVYITQRHGKLSGTAYDSGGVIEGCRFNCSKKKITAEINGVGNTIRGNIATGGIFELSLQCGSVPTGGDTIGVYDAADYASLIENPGMDPLTLGAFNQNNKMDNSRGGLLNNVRLYRGDAVWTPTVVRDTDVDGNQTPASALTSSNGYGPYTKIVPIVASDLLAVAGADDLDIPPEPPEPPAGGGPLPVEDPARTLTVDTAAELTTALAGNSAKLGTLKPGDCIKLSGTTGSPTTYGGTFSLNVNGTAPTDFKDGTPIIIRAVNLLGAKLTGTLTMKGINTWAYGLLMEGAGAKLNVEGNYARAMFCRFKGLRSKNADGSVKDSGESCCPYNGKYNKIWYCEFDDFEGRPVTGNSTSKWLHVAKCWWHDNIPPGGGDGNARECIQLGQTQGGQNTPTVNGGKDCIINMSALLEDCLFRNVYKESTGHDENETISIKASNCVIRRCTQSGTVRGGMLFNNRFGNNNEISSCWIASGYGIGIYGDDTLVLYNVVTGSKVIRCGAGSQTMDYAATGANATHEANMPGSWHVWDDPAAYPVSRRGIYAGNNGTLLVGAVPDLCSGTPVQCKPEVAAQATKIYGHTGTIKTESNNSWSTQDGSLNETGSTYADAVPAAYVRTAPTAALAESAVGPLATWVRPVTWGA